MYAKSTILPTLRNPVVGNQAHTLVGRVNRGTYIYYRRKMVDRSMPSTRAVGKNKLVKRKDKNVLARLKTKTEILKYNHMVHRRRSTYTKSVICKEDQMSYPWGMKGM